MGLNILDANLIAIVALIASTITGWLTWRSNSRRDRVVAETASAQVVIDAYDKLCNDLEQRIEKNRLDTARLETELRALQVQHALDREVWTKEKIRLELQIEALKMENAQLRARLDILQGMK